MDMYTLILFCVCVVWLIGLTLCQKTYETTHTVYPDDEMVYSVLKKYYESSLADRQGYGNWSSGYSYKTRIDRFIHERESSFDHRIDAEIRKKVEGALTECNEKLIDNIVSRINSKQLGKP